MFSNKTRQPGLQNEGHCGVPKGRADLGERNPGTGSAKCGVVSIGCAVGTTCSCNAATPYGTGMLPSPAGGGVCRALVGAGGRRCRQRRLSCDGDGDSDSVPNRQRKWWGCVGLGAQVAV